MTFGNHKNMLNSNILSACPHNMAHFGPLTAEIGSGVWGTPANFNGIRVLTSLLQRRRSTEVNQALHDVWPSPGLVHYIYIFGGSCPHNGILPGTSKSCVLLYWERYCMTLQYTTAAGIGPHSSFSLIAAPLRREYGTRKLS